MSRTVVMASRAHDAVYDPTFITGSSAQLVKAAGSSNVQVVRQPDSANLFSDLANYPRQTLRLKASERVPAHALANLQSVANGTSRSTAPASASAPQLAGTLRYRYFRQPVVASLQGVPANVMLAQGGGGLASGGGLAGGAAKAQAAEPLTKTVGTQSEFRESETQTDPFTPDYAVRPGSAPELVTLATLTWGAGLPAGLAEVEMIERARSKRAFEEALPAIDPEDPSSFEVRRKMLSEQELKEWVAREKEIESIEAARLNIIQQALEQRDADKERANFQRLEHQRQLRVAEKDRFLAKIHKRRLQVLRKLRAERPNVEGRRKKRDIIADYGNFSSEAYAPITRNGGSGEQNAHRFESRPEGLQSLAGLMELEASLPQSMTTTRITKPRMGSDRIAKTAEGRKLQAHMKHLELMEKSIERSKRAAAGGDMMSTTASRLDKYAIVKPIERPATPELAPSAPDSQSRHEAAVFLQRLIRGRAAQNVMFAAKERRSELIKELRLAEVLDDMSEELAASRAATEAKKLAQKVEQSAADAVQGEMVGATLPFLTSELTRLKEQRRIAAVVQLAERTRRMREAEEAGTRQREIAARDGADERFRAVMRLRTGTVENYLSDIIGDQLQAGASAQATAERVDSVVSAQEPELVVQSLLASFLLPEVDRQLVHAGVARAQAKLAIAVRGALSEAVEAVEAAQ